MFGGELDVMTLWALAISPVLFLASVYTERQRRGKEKIG